MSLPRNKPSNYSSNFDPGKVIQYISENLFDAFNLVLSFKSYLEGSGKLRILLLCEPNLEIITLTATLYLPSRLPNALTFRCLLKSLLNRSNACLTLPFWKRNSRMSFLHLLNTYSTLHSKAMQNRMSKLFSFFYVLKNLSFTHPNIKSKKFFARFIILFLRDIVGISSNFPDLKRADLIALFKSVT